MVLRLHIDPDRDDGTMCAERSHADEPPIPVPDLNSDWTTLWRFALSINGYDVADIAELAEREQRMRDNWDCGRGLPDDLHELRLMLFFLQRQHHHLGLDPEGETNTYARAVVEKIAILGGGVVPGPHDFEVFLARDEHH